MTLIAQIRKNLLAVISITIAVGALSYNTYRNELTEENRNMRRAGFEILKELNDLQLLIDYAHYDKSVEHGNPIQGWSHVTYINDMSHLISVDVVDVSNNLTVIWGDNWDSVREDKSANKNITDEIGAMRIVTRKAMHKLK